MGNIWIMKTILAKIKINYLTYFLLLICLLTGLFKNIIIILLIVLIHEFGHIFFTNKLGYSINKVEIYPFGGITEISKDLNAPTNHDLLIASGGVIFQLFLWVIFKILYNFDLITNSTHNLFNIYNKSILIFNLLPIIPLDGHIILKSILEKFLSFKRVHYIIIIISIIGIILYIQYNYVYSINNYMILMLLVYKTFESIKNYKYIYNRFLLERYMNIYPYKKTSHEKTISFQNFKKETLHFFKVGNKFVHEKAILKKKFDKNRHF